MFLDHQTQDGQYLPCTLPLNAVGRWTGQSSSPAEGERRGADGAAIGAEWLALLLGCSLRCLGWGVAVLGGSLELGV